MSSISPLSGFPPSNTALSLVALPVELLDKILLNLTNLSDVLSFAHTCRLFRLLCDESANGICTRVVAFHERARQLLADQGSADFGQTLSTKHLALMLQNWRVVQGTITYFEEDIVQRLYLPMSEDGRVYGKDAQHPLTLMSGERRRFVRAFYTLWSLLIIDPELWQDRLLAISSRRELYYLTDVSFLENPIGSEGLSEGGGSLRPSFYFAKSRKRAELRNVVSDYLEATYTGTGPRKYLRPGDLAYWLTEGEREGIRHHVFLWHHFQRFLRHYLTGQNSYAEDYKDLFWDDSDEEIVAEGGQFVSGIGNSD